MRKRFSTRAVSMLLCIAMILPLILVTPLSSSAAENEDAGSSMETVYDEGIYYTINKKLVYGGNRTYRLDVDITSTLSATSSATQRVAAENGYLTVEKTGWYLIELWGGKGSDGGDYIFLSTSIYPGGHGANGGYVYASVYLIEGQTIVWSIGTNGESTEIKNDDAAGGANGSGGTHGDMGSQKVGGGGGYSAMFLFNEGEFDPNWVTEKGPLNIPESARLSRYILIAGGGGGGGATNIYPDHPANYDSEKDGNFYLMNRADGGAGGNANNGASLTVTGTGVDGYVISGRNGRSTGTTTKYVGRGGSNVPGAIPTTNGGSYYAEPGPNDWGGTYSYDWYDEYGVVVSAGAGGTGNFRGGGGGAGYCGGSGGIQYALLVAESIGGGGGGSSFIASTANDKSMYFETLSDDIKSIRLGDTNCPSTTGGAVSYTYLGEDENALLDTSYLENVTVNGAITQYFNVEQYNVTGGSDFVIDENGNFEVKANIRPANLRNDGGTFKLTFVIKPKKGFVGGNYIKMLDSLSFSFTNLKDENKTITAKEQANSDYANVPLSISIKTNSIMTAKTGVTYPLTDLYVAEYTAFSSAKGPSWEFDYIMSISNYAVYNGKDGAVGTALSSSVTPSSTSYYSVALTVTPQTAYYAEIGPKCETQTFYAVACISIVAGDLLQLGEYTVTANKYLTHDGSNYVFKNEFSQTVSSAIDTANSELYTYAVYQSNTPSYTAPVDGYYLIQAWGAKGGRGQNAQAYAERGSNGSYEQLASNVNNGGSGGNGAAIYGFVYLEAGDSLQFTLGSVGTNYTSTNVVRADHDDPSVTTTLGISGAAAGASGGGGHCAAVSLTKSGASVSEYILIAGGGGGGRGGWAGRTTGLFGWDGIKYGASGTSGTSAGNTFSYELGTVTSDYNGKAGATVSVSGHNSTGTPSATFYTSNGNGQAGANYANANYINAVSNGVDELMLAQLIDDLFASGAVDTTAYNTLEYGSAVQVTPIMQADFMDSIHSLEEMHSSCDFTKYFDVESIDIVVDNYSYDERVESTDGDVITVEYRLSGKTQYSFSYRNTGKKYEILETNYPPNVELSDTDPKEYDVYANFTVEFILSPADGFLGGNDVPLLDGQVAVTHGGETGYLTANPSVDYVNVEVPVDLQQYFSTVDATIDYGQSIESSELYSYTFVTPAEAWKSEFVTVTPPTNETLSPEITTQYSFTASIIPKTANPVAAVVGATGGVSLTLYSTVYVQYAVDYNLTNLTSNGASKVLYGEDLVFYLSANKGYKLPSNVSVTVGSATTNLSCAPDGKVTVPGSMVNGNITVSASAVAVTYTIVYTYDLDDGNGVQTNSQYSYMADSPITDTWAEDFAAALPERDGYDFVWVWDTSDGKKPATMPAHDLSVTGSYIREWHVLTVNYIDENGDQIAKTVTRDLQYGDTFSVTSPKVQYYLADSVSSNDGVSYDPFVVSGTMGGQDITVNVTYRESINELHIIYVDNKGNEIAPGVHLTNLYEGYTYSYTSPTVSGYTPDRTVVSGTMGITSETIIVTYTPDQYNLTFKYQYGNGEYPGGLGYITSDATVDIADAFKVEFGNTYNYNAFTGEYGLPTPVVAGYTFKGWYTVKDGAFDTLIDEDDIVNITADTVLYAMWEPVKYTVTIRFDFVLGQYQAFDYSDFDEPYPDQFFKRFENMDTGATYSYTLPTIEGYTAYINYGIAGSQQTVTQISGTVNMSNVVILVTYVINEYTITFRDNLDIIVYPEGTQDVNKLSTEYKADTVTLEHGAPVPVSYTNKVSRQTTSFLFSFSGWVSSTTGIEYDTSIISFPSATENVEYYRIYTPKEVIALLYSANSSTALGTTISGYYTSVQAAIDAAMAISSSSSSVPTVKLRRNEGMDKVIDLRETETSPTLNIKSTSTRYLKFDLNGIKLVSNQTVIDCTEYLYVIDSTGGGEIYAEADGDVIGINTTEYLYLGGLSTTAVYPITITVISQNGVAKGVYATDYCYLYGVDVSATSNGTDTTDNAYGVHTTNRTHLYNYYIEDGATFAARTNKGTAYGAYIGQRIYTYYSSSYTQGKTLFYGSSDDGDAYGIYITTLYTDYFYANAEAVAPNGTAYALYSLSTYDYIYGTSSTDFTATATGKNAVGMYINYGTSYMNVVVEGTESAIGIETTATSTLYVYENVSVSSPNGTAIGLKSYYTTTVSSSNYASSISVNTITGQAIGVTTNNNYTVTLNTGTTITVTAEDGDAYAFKDCTVSTSAAVPITVSATTGNAYGFKNVNISAFSTSATVTVSATTGNAYGFAYDGTGSVTYHANAKVTVSAEDGGNAYGIYVENGTVSVQGDVDVYGTSAYGIYATGGTVNANSSGAVINVSTPVTADEPETDGTEGEGTGEEVTPEPPSTEGTIYGVYLESGAKLSNTVAATVNVTAENGNAYGVYNLGTINSINLVINVIAPYTVYGVANLGTLTTTYSSFKVTATSDLDDAYALYNNGGTVGSETLAGSIRYGVLTATTNGEGKNAYGIYSESGNVYVRGTGLYFKGSTVENALNDENVVIYEGYEEIDATGTYDGYRTLSIITYTLIFKETYYGVTDYETDDDYANVTVIEYTVENTSITAPIFTAEVTGFTSYWEAYDFTAPTDGTSKVVLSGYERNTYTITFVLNGGTGTETLDVLYDYDIVLPADPTKYANGFTGWYEDEALTALYVFGKMPASNFTVYAGWDVGTFTITFNTNGGTAVEAITGLYDTEITTIPAAPTKTGYLFAGWYADETLTNAYTFIKIPGENITVYAKWTLVNYYFNVDGMSRSYTVNFYNNASDTTKTTYVVDGTLLSSVVPPTPKHTSNSDIPSFPLACRTTIYTQKYLFTGWYLDQGTTQLANVNGSIGDLDEDGDGIVNLYAKWQNQSYSRITGTLTTVKGSYYRICPYLFDGGTSTTWGWYYVTYPVYVSGTYTLSVLNYVSKAPTSNTSYYNKTVEISVQKANGTTQNITSSVMNYTTSLEAYTNYNIDVSAGDVIVLRACQYSGDCSQSVSYDTDIYAYLSSVPDGVTGELSNTGISVYNVEMEDIILPTGTVENQVGWGWMENGVLASGKYITSITPDLIGTVAEWSDPSNPQILYLYPVIANPSWKTSIEEGRQFKEFTTALTDVTVRADGTVTALLLGDGTGIPSLEFLNGLPKGTLLTLVDLTGEPVYYHYTVTASGLISLPLTAFVKMGGTENFGGTAEKLLVSICYSGTEHAFDGEEITLYVNDEATDEAVSYSLIHMDTVNYSPVTVPYNTAPTGNVTIPSLVGKGFNSDDKVVLVIRIEDADGNILTIPAGMSFTYEGIKLKNMGYFTYFEFGTVADYENDVTISGVIDFHNMRYLNYSGNFVYDIVVVSSDTDLSDGSCFGVDSYVEKRNYHPITIIDTPKVTVTGNTETVAPGGTFDLTYEIEQTLFSNELSIYVYQLSGGKMQYTDACGTLLTGVTVGADGKLTTTTVPGTDTFNVSATASEGVYYVVVYYYDQYDVYVLKVKD